MTTLNIELKTEGYAQTTADLLRKLADRLESEGLPTQSAYLIRDFTGDIAGQATITTKGA